MTIATTNEVRHWGSGHPTAERDDCPWCNSEPDTRIYYVLYKETDGLVYYKRHGMPHTTVRNYGSMYLAEEALSIAATGGWKVAKR